MSEVLRDYHPTDGAAARDLWSRSFGVPAGGQDLDWLFRPGPGGEPLRAVAECDGRVVAHAGVAAVRFRLSRELVRGGLSVGAMTAPEMRGRGLFARLGRYLYARMEEEGFAFVAGFSNRASHRLMTGPLGRTPIRPFPWCVRPLLWRGVARGETGQIWARPQTGDVRISPCEPGDARLDILWRGAAATIGVGAVRDAAFSAWRFGSRPDADYRLLLAEANGRPAAAGVVRVLRVRGLETAFLADYLVDPDELEAGAALLRAVARGVRARGAALLSALLPPRGPERRTLRRFGFVRVPELLHPQVIRYSVRGLGTHSDCRELIDPAAWFLTWADTDVV